MANGTLYILATYINKDIGFDYGDLECQFKTVSLLEEKA